MIQCKKKWTRFAGLALALAMLGSTCLPALKVEAEEDRSGGTEYEGEANAMTQEEYAEFGLINHSPEEFDPNDSSNPMEGYEATVLSELYIGQMGRHDKWKGSYMVLNNTTEISKKAFDVDAMARDTVGTEKSFNEFYAQNKDKKEVQTHNACAIDYDNDGTDEILDVTLYVDKEFKDDPKQRSCLDIRVYDMAADNDSEPDWKVTGSMKYELADSKSDASTFVYEIEADASKGLAALAAGDYDGDGMEEGAVYIPSQAGDNAYIAIVKMTEGAALKEIDRIGVNELNGTDNTFNFRYKSWKMPIVSLTTTKISGGDDLVVNISHPLKSNDGYGSQGQNSSIGIFHYDGGDMKNRYLDAKMESGKSRMRFCSAIDADLNGNGVSELVVGGYKNKDWNSTTDVGNLASDKNLIQLICWNQEKKAYEKVWDAPKEIEAHGGLKTDLEMTEPAALAAGKLAGNNADDQVFLEGNVFKYVGASTDGADERSLHQSGSFSKVHSMSLGGSHSAFISTAHAAKFTTAGGASEQIVVLSGDHQNMNNDNIYYDICWIWQDGANIKSEVTNNDYIDCKDEDDNGTFVSLCPLDADQDAIYMDYRKKTYGWSEPVLHSILQSPPYWSELEYNSESYGAGKASYKITYGSSAGTDGDWGVGVGIGMECSLVAGGGLVGNNAMFGGGFEFEAMGKYIGSYGKSHSISDSYEIAVPPGEDQAIMMAVPVVTYHYDLWVPEYTVTQKEIDSYNELQSKNPDVYPEAYTVYVLDKETGKVDENGTVYSIGDKVPGHWEDSRVVSTLTPSFSHLSLEEYNELAKKYPDSGLKEVSDDFFHAKKIGDPSSYPHSKEMLYRPENMGEIYLSRQTANVAVGEGEHTLSYETEDDTEEVHGFNLSFSGGAYLKAVSEISFGLSVDGEFQFGGRGEMEGGASWVTTNSKGVEYTASVVDLAKDATEDYKFNAQMAVFEAKDLPRGDGSSEGTHIVGYIVTGIDEGTAPPKLPVDLRLFGTTKTEAVIKWETSAGNRSAKSYEIYAKDNLGEARVVGRTEDTYFVAKELEPGTQYQFAVKAYDGGILDGRNTGRASCLSRWVTAVTKSGSKKAPHFTEHPRNVVVSLESPDSGDGHAGGQTVTLSAKAETGEGAEGAALSYQWQKYAHTALTQEGTWEDIAGGVQNEDGSTAYTLSEIHAEDLLGYPAYYRVIATQTKGSTVESVISKTAAVYVNEGGAHVSYQDVELELDMESANVVYQMDKSEERGEPATYYMNCGETDAAFQIRLASGGAVLDSGEIHLMYYEGNQIKTFKGGKGSIHNGQAVITLSGEIERGVYRVFAVYPGSTGTDENGTRFLAAVSEPIEIRAVDAYHLEYHLNGGGQRIPFHDIFMYEGEPAKVYVADPMRHGYSFEGWCSNRALTRKVPDEGIDKDDRYVMIDPLQHDGDENGETDHVIDLYAVWTPIVYTVQYELSGGENAPGNPESFTVEDPRIPLKDPVYPGHIFKGWYSDPEFTQKVDSVAGGSMGDVTLYARWEEGAGPLTLSLPMFGLHVTVSGMIEPGTELKFVKLAEDHQDYQAMKAAVAEPKKFKEGWRLSLLKKDRSAALWSGELTVHIRADNKDILKNLSVLHRDKQGIYSELAVTEPEEGITFTTDSPENIGLLMAESSENEPGTLYPEGDKGPGDAGDWPQDGNKDLSGGSQEPRKAAKTGDAGQPIAAAVLVLLSGLSLLLTGRRRVQR